MIIDTIEVVIFVVPTKCSKEGSIIHPWDVNTIDAHFDVTKDTIWSPRYVVKIPPRLFKIILGCELRVRKFCFFWIEGTMYGSTSFRKGESGTKFFGIYIVAILHAEFSSFVFHNVPIILFQILRNESTMVFFIDRCCFLPGCHSSTSSSSSTSFVHCGTIILTFLTIIVVLL